MKYTMIRFAIAVLLGVIVGNSANAGFGSQGGLFGGGSGGASAGHGSSGNAGYGSSGGIGYGSSGSSYSGYGSSGGNYVASYGSSGGGSNGGGSNGGGSSGGAASAGGSSGRPGLLSRLHSRVHSHIAAKHARHASYGSSGGGSSGGYAGYGSTGGSSGSGYNSVGGGSSGRVGYRIRSVGYGSTGSSSYGSTGSAIHSGYGSAGSVIGSGPVMDSGYGSVGGSIVPGPVNHGTSTTSPARSSALVSNSRFDDSVKLNVSVPASAKVYVNDRLTTSTGELRQFVSRGLESGKSYRFEIRAEMNDNGNIVTDSQSVVVTAGSQENVRFAIKAAPKAEAKIDTAVVLNVPENAEVTLAGNQTQVKGTTRVFKTSQLNAGDVWDDYVIQVKVGEQVKSQSIRLIAGDKLELSFDFDNDANRLAAK